MPQRFSGAQLCLSRRRRTPMPFSRHIVINLLPCVSSPAVCPPQVSAEIPMIVRLCDDLRKEYEPKVSVQSAASFEGKVWE